MENDAKAPLPLDAYAVAPEFTTLSIDEILVESDVCPRLKLDQTVIANMVASLKQGINLPRLTVFKSDDKYRLADGWHRREAHKLYGSTHVEVEVLYGSREDAQVHAICTNAKHGIRLSNAEKRLAVERLSQIEEFKGRSYTEIAEMCCCTGPTVKRVYQKLGLISKEPGKQVRGARNKHGTRHDMKTANFGRKGARTQAAGSRMTPKRAQAAAASVAARTCPDPEPSNSERFLNDMEALQNKWDDPQALAQELLSAGWIARDRFNDSVSWVNSIAERYWQLEDEERLSGEEADDA